MSFPKINYTALLAEQESRLFDAAPPKVALLSREKGPEELKPEEPQHSNDILYLDKVEMIEGVEQQQQQPALALD